MKKIDISLIIGILFTILVSNFAVFTNNCADLREDVIRLHIIANSDSEDDQKLKLKVRDAILEKSPEVFENCISKEDAEGKIISHVAKIQQIASQEIISNGYQYKVVCQTVNMEFNERKYKNFTLPSGNYDALRVIIGDGDGKNWWCVMYPPLCIPASGGVDEYEAAFSKEEIDIMKNPQKYHAKFKILELYEKISKWMKKE